MLKPFKIIQWQKHWMKKGSRSPILTKSLPPPSNAAMPPGCVLHPARGGQSQGSSPHKGTFIQFPHEWALTAPLSLLCASNFAGASLRGPKKADWDLERATISVAPLPLILPPSRPQSAPLPSFFPFLPPPHSTTPSPTSPSPTDLLILGVVGRPLIHNHSCLLLVVVAQPCWMVWCCLQEPQSTLHCQDMSSGSTAAQ